MEEYNFQIFSQNYKNMISFDPIRHVFKIFYSVTLFSIFFILIGYVLKKESSFLKYTNLYLLYANLLISCGFLIPVFFQNEFAAIVFFSFLLLIQFTTIVTFDKFTMKITNDFDYTISLIMLQLLNIHIMLKLKQNIFSLN